MTIVVTELDIQRNSACDFTSPAVQKHWLQKIAEGKYFAVVSTPPCSTFSRAAWANEEGPFPLRSRIHLWGFPWNSPKRRQKADFGNTLGLFSYEALKRQARWKKKVFFKEQPEDLGRAKGQRVPGHQPASMWMMPQCQELLAMEDVQTCVFPQSAFGIESVKPTRFLFRCPGELHPSMRLGMPHFDEAGWYLGPLEKLKGVPMIGQTNGRFRTSAAAAWPPKLCQWVANQIVTAFVTNSAEEGEVTKSNLKPKKRSWENEGGSEEEEGSDKKRRREADVVEVDPMDPLVKGGVGAPRACEWKGGLTPFHDGGGLCSPGRWTRELRKVPDDSRWKRLREALVESAIARMGSMAELEREAFKMAKGGEGFSLVRDEVFLEGVRKIFAKELGIEENDCQRAEGQPFFLGLIRRMLEEGEDPDCAFLREAESGLPLGVLNPLPRTPSVYERQTKWSLDPVAEGDWVYERENYSSAEEHETHLRAHLETEVAEGLMEKMNEEVFLERFGDSRAVASLAVLVEDVTVGKKRVIHDGTHGIAVNNRIRCLDKVRMPGPREKRKLLEEFEKEKVPVLSMVGDVAKAHRRFLYAAEERGFLACKAAKGDAFVYVNKVGTFGVTSTPYWWSRISACVIRLLRNVLGKEWPIEALLYADDLEVMAPGRRGRVGAVLGFVTMAAVGTPFKWSKQRGGLASEWVGFTTDYREFSLGLSLKRATWVIDWIKKLEEDKEVTDREFAAGLGRLSFASLALPWERPLLGPLFAWNSAVRGSFGKMSIPWAVLFVLGWIRRKLEGGMRMERIKAPVQEKRRTVRIWTDAKATDAEAWIGGWLEESEETKKCSWFSMEVDEESAPWLLMRKRNPKRMIAALEMLATVIALKLWLKRGEGEFQIHAEAFTDNLGNDHILRRSMSTKFPLTLLVIEISEMLRAVDATAKLRWVRRDDNQGADDLTNCIFTRFAEEKRVHFKVEEGTWLVLDELMKESKKVFEEIQEMKLRKKEEKAKKGSAYPRKRVKKGKFFDRWPG